MSLIPFLNWTDPEDRRLVWVLVQIAAIWSLADAGYYLLLPAMEIQSNYNGGSIAIMLYYVFWTGISVIAFWPVYASWPEHAAWTTFGNRLTSSIVWSLAFAGSLLFAAYILPLLPTVHWKESWTPPDLVVATPTYFLPKSIEILFQQLLIVALVLALAARHHSIRAISVICAAAFGSTHVLLALGGVPTGYVFRFMASAAAFGFIFPYLILRVPNGLAYSYALHWAYYALSAVLPHLFMTSAK